MVFRLSNRKRLFTALAVFVGLGCAATLLGLGLSSPNTPVAAQAGGAAVCANPGLYTGVNDSGQFQAALEDAIARAEACAGCCDLIVNYEVLSTTGERGGFAFRNNIFVEIRASW